MADKPAKKAVETDFLDPDLEIDPDSVQTDDPEEDDAAVAARKPSRRARATVELALRGANFGEIAEIQGYDTPAAAQAAFEQTIAWLAGPPEGYAAAQQKIAMQYDLLIKSLSVKAHSPWITDPNDQNPDKSKRKKIANPEHIAYVREMRATLIAKAELIGAKAPSRIQIDTPDAAKMDQVVKAVVATQRGEQPAGGDIFSLDAIGLEPGPDGVFRLPSTGTDG